MKPFDFGGAELSRAEVFNEVDDPMQCPFDNRLARSGGGESQHGTLPEILIAALGHRDVEFVTDPSLDTFHHPAFAFEGVVFRNRQLELEDSHHHSSQKATLDPAYARRLAPGLRRSDAPDHRNALVRFDHVALLDVLESFQ
jgi:hypothetical protein